MGELHCGFPDEPNSLIHYGPTVSVRIGFDVNYRPVPGASPVLPEKIYLALIDTGATESYIDTSLASLLQLPIVNRCTLAVGSGLLESNMFAAQISISVLNFNIYGSFAGVHLETGGNVHHAILGRTFLRHLRMGYDGKTGQVTLKSYPPLAPGP